MRYILILLALAQAPTVNVDSVISWSQPGADLTSLRCCYKIYVDAATAGTPLAGVTCSGNASPFACTAPAPIFPAAGTHTIAVTHVTGYGESSKSATLSVAVVGAGPAPTNLVVGLPPPPPTPTITLAPTGDTTLNIDPPIVHAGDTTLNVYTFPDTTAANVILLQFDVSAIPATAQIQSALLSLTLVQADTFSEALYTVTAHRIYRPGIVLNVALATGALYDGVNAWTPVPGRTVPLAQMDFSPPYDTQAVDKALGVKTFTLTRMVQEWVSNQGANIGAVLLNSDGAALKDRFRFFASNESATVAARPSLKVTYTP